MAYNSYFPQFYQPYQGMSANTPQMVANQPQGSGGGIIWVQGEAAAKAYPVASGASVLLMDSESSVMYIKSTDQSGMPQPLRIFDYTERIGNGSEAGIIKKNDEDYVSRQEFEEFREEMKKSIKGIRKPKIKDEEDDE